MKKGEIYEAIVEKVEFPNKGIVHVGEEKVIVKNDRKYSLWSIKKEMENVKDGF